MYLNSAVSRNILQNIKQHLKMNKESVYGLLLSEIIQLKSGFEKIDYGLLRNSPSVFANTIVHARKSLRPSQFRGQWGESSSVRTHPRTPLHSTHIHTHSRLWFYKPCATPNMCRLIKRKQRSFNKALTKFYKHFESMVLLGHFNCFINIASSIALSVQNVDNEGIIPNLPHDQQDVVTLLILDPSTDTGDTMPPLYSDPNTPIITI